MILGASGAAECATYYADSGIRNDCIGTYDPKARTCGGGSAVAYPALQGAMAAALPGDTVLVREGTYAEQLAPPRSGEPGRHITIKGYAGETAVLSGINEPAILLLNRSYLIIEGLRVNDVLGWGRIERSTHNILRGNRFQRTIAKGTTGGLKFVKSSYNRVLGNSFEEGNDSVLLQESDRNLVEGNTFTSARHSLLSIRCGNFNVVRGNRFSNPYQKNAEIYDCEGASDAPVKLDATKHNVFEGNVFTSTRGADRPYRYNGIQYVGQNGIVRRNVFYDNQGGALNFQVYPTEALYNNNNHVYNNTFYNNRCYGVSASTASRSSRYYGNVVSNNLFFRNTDCSGGATQNLIGRSGAVKFEGNAVVTESPRFVDEAARDFHLTSGSPMVDAGIFASRTAKGGTGKVIPVDDVGYFYDGFGIPGETGDIIQLEGQKAVARISKIQYQDRTLTIDEPLAWSAGQKIHLRYSGSRPDVGAYEFSPEGGPALQK